MLIYRYIHSIRFVLRLCRKGFIMILHEIVLLSDIEESGNRYFPDIVKFCIDIKRRIVCIDEEMHIDMEHMLYDDGSDYNDIYGGNIIIDEDVPRIVWEAHPNIERNKRLGGQGRLLSDPDTIEKLKEILVSWVK